MSEVLLVSMPFADVRFPALGLSLLKAVLVQSGIPCDVAYLNRTFHSHMSTKGLYGTIAQQPLVADWVFSEDLFGSPSGRRRKEVPGDTTGMHRPGAANRALSPEELNSVRAMVDLFLEDSLQSVRWADYRIIGFTSQFAQHVGSLAMARRIKARWPEKIIVFGGSNCEGSMGEALLRLFPFVDWVCSGEGEWSFPTAVNRWLSDGSPHDVPGIAFREGSRIVTQGRGPLTVLDRLPYPDLTDFFVGFREGESEPVPGARIQLEFSRGCWWGRKRPCAFCGMTGPERAFRRKAPRRAAEEVRTVVQRYGSHRVYLTDSVLDRSYLTTLLPVLGEWGGVDDLFLESRPDLSREEFEVLRKAGVRKFQAGLESLDSAVLDHMGKGTCLLHNVQFLKWAREMGVSVGWNLLYGLPGEDPASYERMAALIPLLTHLRPPVSLIPIRVQRWSPLFDDPEHWGLRRLRACADYKSIYPFADRDLKELGFFFDADWDGKQLVEERVSPLLEQVLAWWECWEEIEPPLLGYQETDGQISIFDTRPGRIEPTAVLKDELATAYLVCDTARSFDEIVAEITVNRSRSHGDHSGLLRGLDTLVAKRLMLSEGGRYLSLANNIEALDATEGTVLTRLLLRSVSSGRSEHAMPRPRPSEP